MRVPSWAVDKDGRTQNGFCASLSAKATYGVSINICSKYSFNIFQRIIS
jgi:hypothetical protein